MFSELLFADFFEIQKDFYIFFGMSFFGRFECNLALEKLRNDVIFLYFCRGTSFRKFIIHISELSERKNRFTTKSITKLIIHIGELS